MWGDIVLQAEQQHLLRLLLWAAASVLAGTATLVLAATRRQGSTLLRAFGASCAAIGVAELGAAWIGYRALAMRDLAGAARLERATWLELGIFIGLLIAGALLVAAGRLLGAHTGAMRGRALTTMGIGSALAMHGASLALLAAILASAIAR